jgi:MazG family protein
MTPELPSSSSKALGALTHLIKTLRGEKGCPWDRKQTPRSICVYLTEEIYELIDAIESGNPDRICEELGDVLFQIFFIARIFEEMGHFDIATVARSNTEKMTRRHPHVFGEDRVESTQQIRERWHEIKKKEKTHTAGESGLDSVPVQLPALIRAYRISERAARTGFDWPDITGVIEKVTEQWDELKQALLKDRRQQTAIEFGDILFTLAHIARLARIHPETALTGSIKKFEKRFKKMEKTAGERGESLEALSQTDLDALWQESKTSENL